MDGVELDTLECKESLLWWMKRGLSYTQTGYGSKIPTSKMVRLTGEKVWRRVYVRIYSNVGTSYILVKGKQVIVW